MPWEIRRRLGVSIRLAITFLMVFGLTVAVYLLGSAWKRPLDPPTNLKLAPQASLQGSLDAAAIPPANQPSSTQTPDVQDFREWRHSLLKCFSNNYVSLHSRLVRLREGHLWDGLRPLLEDPELIALSKAVSTSEDGRALEYLLDLQANSDSDLKHFSLLLLALSGNPKLEVLFRREFESRHRDDPIAASLSAWGLSRIGTESALQPVITRLEKHFESPATADVTLQYCVGMAGRVGLNALLAITERLLRNGALRPDSLLQDHFPLAFCMDSRQTQILRELVLNHDSRIVRMMALQPLLSSKDGGNADFVVDQFLALTDPALKSALGKRIMRNVVVGNLDALSDTARKGLVEYVLEEPESHPAGKLGILLCLDKNTYLPEVRKALLETREGWQSDPQLRNSLALWLTEQGSAESASVVQEYAVSGLLSERDNNPLVFLHQLKQLDSGPLREQLIQFIRASSDFTRMDLTRNAVLTLSLYPTGQREELLSSLNTIYAGSASPKARLAILEGITSFGNEGQAMLIREARHSQDDVVRIAAWTGVAKIDMKDGRLERLEEAKNFVREMSDRQMNIPSSGQAGLVARSYTDLFSQVFTRQPTKGDIAFLERMAQQPVLPITCNNMRWDAGEHAVEDIRRAARAALELLRTQAE